MKDSFGTYQSKDGGAIATQVHMTRRTKPMRRRSRWLLGLLAVIVLLWIGYWYAAHSFADAAIERATTAGPGGAVVECDGRSLGGFPLRLDLSCGRVTYAEPELQLTAAVDGIATSAPLYWPGHVDAALGGPMVINAPPLDLALTTSWQAATGTVQAGLGGLQSVSASFARPSVENGGGTRHLPFTAAVAEQATAMVEPADDGAYTFAAAADGLELTLADGRAFPVIDGNAHITALDVGDNLGMAPQQTMRDWLRRGATVEIDRVKLATTDNTIDMSGRLSLSDGGLLSGNVDVRFTNLEALPDLIEAIRPGSRDQAAQAVGALAAFTIPVETEDGPARQTTLVIKDGLVAVGIIPIGQIPPIRF